MYKNADFHVGSIAYCKETGLEVYIDAVNIVESHAGIDIHYRCQVEADNGYYYYKEDELTDKRPTPNTEYEFKMRGKYYILNPNGDVTSSLFYDKYDQRLEIDQGNAFPNKEEANKEKRHRAVRQELKKLAGGYQFKLGEENYFIDYDHMFNRPSVSGLLSTIIADTIYFESEEAAKRAIEIIGKERLIRDYFMVEK